MGQGSSEPRSPAQRGEAHKDQKAKY